MTSYLSFYKSGGLVVNPPLYNISNESFIQNSLNNIKKVFDYIVNLFKKVFTWIKDKINNVLKNRIFKNKIEKIKKKKKLATKSLELSNISLKDILLKVLTNRVSNESNELLDHFKPYSGLFISYFFTNDGKLFDLDYTINDCTKYVEAVLAIGIKSVFSEGIAKQAGMYNKSNFNDYEEEYQIIKNISNKITLDELYKHVNDIDSMVNKCHIFYRKYEPKITSKINEIKQSLQTNPDDLDLNHSLGLYNNLVRVILRPLTVVLGYANLLDIVSGELTSNKYISTTLNKDQKLLHLSLDANLTELTPRLPISGSEEYLPPRVSFAPTVEECFKAINHLIDVKTSGTKVISLYLYEGILDKDTRIIKPELVLSAVSDAWLTNEVCVLTRIKVKKISKVNMTYNTDNGVKLIGVEYA